MTLCQENSKSCLISRMIFITFYVRFHELLRKRTVNILLKQNRHGNGYRNECQESISKTWFRYACLVFEVFHIHLKCHVTPKLWQASHTQYTHTCYKRNSANHCCLVLGFRNTITDIFYACYLICALCMLNLDADILWYAC